MPRPSVPSHQDPGLQPERTTLAWGRTALALFAAGLLFLRWLPYYGPWILLLIVLTGSLAVGIYLTQRRRYSSRVTGIAAERFPADVHAILWTSGAVLLTGVLSLIILITA
jgi:uncharacterized membrane protein YidH (DUF202 family)